MLYRLIVIILPTLMVLSSVAWSQTSSIQGSVQWFQPRTITSGVSGIVNVVSYQPGARFARDELLIQLNQAPFDTALATEQASIRYLPATLSPARIAQAIREASYEAAEPSADVPAEAPGEQDVLALEVRFALLFVAPLVRTQSRPAMTSDVRPLPSWSSTRTE